MSRSSTRQVVSSLVLVVILGAIGVQSASACSCAGRSVDAVFADADAVLIGTTAVVDHGYIRVVRCWLQAELGSYVGMPLPDDWAEEELMCGVRAKVTVERQFKGAPVKSLFIVTGRGWGDCGFPFKQGERYLLYLYEDGTRYRTNVCTGSMPVEMAADALATIEALVGKGAAP